MRWERREGGGGGCTTFLKQGIPCRIIGIGNKLEHVVVKVWAEKKELVIVNYFNPCKRLDHLEAIEGQSSSNIVWSGVFKDTTLYGGVKEQTVMVR